MARGAYRRTATPPASEAAAATATVDQTEVESEYAPFSPPEPELPAPSEVRAAASPEMVSETAEGWLSIVLSAWVVDAPTSTVPVTVARPAEAHESTKVL